MTKVDRIKRALIVSATVAISSGVWFACKNASTTNNNNTAASDKTVSSADAGKTIYQQTCLPCHGSSGEGMQGTYPPLAKSDFLLADKNRAIHQVLEGSSATYIVNGVSYNGMMPPQQLSNEQIAQVLDYVYHAWGNNGPHVTTADVKAVKDTIK